MMDLSSSSASSLDDDIATSTNRPLVVDDHNEQPSSSTTKTKRWSWPFKGGKNSTSSSSSCVNNNHVVSSSADCPLRGRDYNNDNAPSLLDDAPTAQEIEFFNQAVKTAAAAPAAASAINQNFVDDDEEQQQEQGNSSSSLLSFPDELGGLLGLPPTGNIVSVVDDQQTPPDLARIESSFVLALRRVRSGRRRSSITGARRQQIWTTLFIMMLVVTVVVVAYLSVESQQDNEKGRGAPAKRIWDWCWGAVCSMIMRVKEAARKI